jgi:hypothetical protein
VPRRQRKYVNPLGAAWEKLRVCVIAALVLKSESIFDPHCNVTGNSNETGAIGRRPEKMRYRSIDS